MNDTIYEVKELEKKETKKTPKLILIILTLIVLILLAILFNNHTHTNNTNNIESVVINTKDKIAPTLMDISIRSDNENDNQYAQIGNIVYLTFKSDEPLENTPTVYIDNQKVKVLKADNHYIAQYEVTEQYDEDFIITFNICDYKDKAGNVGIEVFNTNDFSKVIISALNKDIEKVKIQSAKFDKNDIYILVNDTTKLSLLIEPLNAIYEEIIWQSSNPTIATVEDGVITAKKPGQTKITAIIEDIRVTTNVWVVNDTIVATSLKIKDIPQNIYVGESFKLKAEIQPTNTTNNNIKWTSSNNNIATIINGTLFAKSEGNVTIKATVDKITTSIDLTIKTKTIDISSITLNINNATIYVGNTINLKASIAPYNATNKEIKWSSSDTSTATVNNNGTVTAKKNGTAIITATAGGKSTRATITIKNPITSLEISPTSLNIKLGSTATIKALINSKPADNNEISWTSSNPNVATVNNSGVVTAKAKGTAVITATAGEITKSTTINVIVPVTGISLNKKTETIYLNSNTNTTTLTATITPSNADNKAITWSSSNTNIATINNGKVTAISPGTATITATTADGNKTATYTITVKKKIIFVIGASQVTRMKKWVSSYTSSANNYSYTTSGETLNFIEKSGSGFGFQTTTGWNQVHSKITAYSSVKKYIDFYVFFPMAGNDIKTFTCNPAYPNHEKFISSSNSYINQYANNFNTIISDIKKAGYQVQGYVVSVQPVVVSQGKGSEYLVTNNNANACKLNYRSNEKYYIFNKAMEEVLKSSTYTANIKYLSLFSYIMQTNDEGTNFSYKVTYNTEDGVHWDEQTTIYYVKLMLNETRVL
jgi:uncharacterized protein YjdB